MSESLAQKTLAQLSELLHKGEVRSVELTEHFLQRIEKFDKELSCYITVTAEQALEAAKKADARLQKKEQVTALTGIPLGIKDIFLTQGIRTTCASKILENFIAPYDGTAIKRLKDAGAVVLGKLNMDEFAMGSSTETSHFGVTRNPWNLECIPGGSSGGSAAAVASGLCVATLGTDTGGSIRQPASHCGIAGIKPTYGRVSRYGVIAFASSLDQVGPMAQTVTDAAHLLRTIAGHDPLDSTSSTKQVPDYVAGLQQGMEFAKGKKLGIPKQYLAKSDALDPAVLQAFEEARKTFEKMGAKIVEVDMPHCDYAITTYYIIAPAEASSNLARYDGIRYGHRTTNARTLSELYKRSRAEGFGDEVKRRILLGTYVLSAGYYDAYYSKALKIRRLIRDDFEQAFKQCDALISPVTPQPAFKIHEKVEDPLQMYLSDIFTIAVNLAGLPGMSVPCGFSPKGLPIGLQIMGAPFEEGKLLQLAYAYEQACPWWKQKPKNYFH